MSRRPTIEKHQSWQQQPKNEARFEFYSSKHDAGGLLTMTDTEEGLRVDIWNVDPEIVVIYPNKPNG